MQTSGWEYLVLMSIVAPVIGLVIGLGALYLVIKAAVVAALRQVGFTRPNL